MHWCHSHLCRFVLWLYCGRVCHRVHHWQSLGSLGKKGHILGRSLWGYFLVCDAFSCLLLGMVAWRRQRVQQLALKCVTKNDHLLGVSHDGTGFIKRIFHCRCSENFFCSLGLTEGTRQHRMISFMCMHWNRVLCRSPIQLFFYFSCFLALVFT